MIEVPPPDLYQDEQMSLFHLIKRRKQREQRTITHIMDPNSEMQTSTKGILNTFSDCLRRKYAPIHVGDGCIRSMPTAGHQRLSESWKVTLYRLLATDEPYRAIHKGGGTKSPRRDGISNEFFKTNLEELKEKMLEIFTQMLVEQKLTDFQKR
jgi:hypothetical protein